MRKDISIAIIGALLLVGWLLYRGIYSRRELIYVTCDSFPSQQEAQDYFIENAATHLDKDKDGIACEDNVLASPSTIIPRIVRPTPVSMQPSAKPTQITPQSTQTTPVIKVEGKATFVVEDEKENKKEEKEEKKEELKSTPTPTPTPNPTPIIGCVLTICI
jgi:hypothetical protein